MDVKAAAMFSSNSSDECGPVRQNQGCKPEGIFRGIDDANRPSTNGRGGSHDGRLGKYIQRPAATLGAIPESMVEEIILEQPMSTASAPAPVSRLPTTPTHEAPAPAAMNVFDNKTDTPPALAPAMPLAITRSGSTSKPISLRTSPHVPQGRENLTFQPYNRSECHHAGVKRTSLVRPGGSGSSTPFSQYINGSETSAIAPHIQTAIEPDRDFISRFYDED